jgi:hypothetical protein
VKQLLCLASASTTATTTKDNNTDKPVDCGLSIVQKAVVQVVVYRSINEHHLVVATETEYM